MGGPQTAAGSYIVEWKTFSLSQLRYSITEGSQSRDWLDCMVQAFMSMQVRDTPLQPFYYHKQVQLTGLDYTIHSIMV